MEVDVGRTRHLCRQCRSPGGVDARANCQTADVILARLSSRPDRKVNGYWRASVRALTGKSTAGRNA